MTAQRPGSESGEGSVWPRTTKTPGYYTPIVEHYPGLTKRELFAAMAMQAHLPITTSLQEIREAYNDNYAKARQDKLAALAVASVAAADALLAELERTSNAAPRKEGDE